MFSAGYDIPEGTTIFANNHAMHMTGPIWGDNPEEFDPRHFLRTNEKGEEVFYSRPESFLPFSYGKRSCMGYRVVEKVSLVVSWVDILDELLLFDLSGLLTLFLR